MSNDYPKPMPSTGSVQFAPTVRPINGEPMLKREEMAALVYKLMDDKTAVSTREELNDWYGTAFAVGTAGVAGMGIAAASAATAAAATAGEYGAAASGFGSANAGMAARVTMGVVNAAPVLGLIAMPMLLTGDTEPTPWYQNNIGSTAFAIVDHIPPTMWTAGVATQIDLRPILHQIPGEWSADLLKGQTKVAKTMAVSIAKLTHSGSTSNPGWTPQQIDAYATQAADAWKTNPSIVGKSPTVIAADVVQMYTQANNEPVLATPTPSTNNEPITTTSLAPTTTTAKPAPTTTTMAPTTTTLPPTTTTSTTTSSTMPPTTTTIAPPTATTTTTSSTMPTTTTPPTAPPATTPSASNTGTATTAADPFAAQLTNGGVATSPVLDQDGLLLAFRTSAKSPDLVNYGGAQNGTTDFGHSFQMEIGIPGTKPMSAYSALAFLYTRTNAEVQVWEDRMLKAGVYDIIQDGHPQMEGNAHDPANIVGWDWLLSKAALAGVNANTMLNTLTEKHQAELQQTGMPTRFIEDAGTSQGRPAYNSSGHVLHYDASGNVVTTSADLTSPMQIIQYGNKVSQALANRDLSSDQINGLQNLIWDMQSAYKPQTAASADGTPQAFDHQAAIYQILSGASVNGGIAKQLDDAVANATKIQAAAGKP